ncbi:MAG: hypothetical protein WDN09_02945 [bacterium]
MKVSISFSAPDRYREDGEYVFLAKKDSSGKPDRRHTFYKVQYGEDFYRIVYGQTNHLLISKRTVLGNDRRIIEGIR